MQAAAKKGKLLIITAPSGAGKTTIVKYLLKTFDNLAFSVSATTRPRREYEKEGVDYFFKSVEDFKKLVEERAFLEWQEVYTNQFYGTLKSEVDRMLAEGKSVIFDIDVEGALNLEKLYKGVALSIFIKPPSKEVLLERLRSRKTETPESLKKRIEKATKELTYESKFDRILVNDDLEKALQTAEKIVRNFLK